MASGEQLDLIDDQLEDETESGEIPFRYAITSYGADYPVDSLVKRIESGAIFVPPFQRDYVWSLPQASRFVESLLLGLPVPGVFFSKEPETEKLLVIDGQQRLRTLSYFYGGIIREKQFALKDVQERFDGKTYRTLEAEDRLRLDDAIIHATVIKQDEPSEDESSVYHIFERLNTGGTPLNPQEIRACLYHGELNKTLNELNDHPAWRALYGKKSVRMKDQELILRFFALFFLGGSYARPMKGFLNTYMAKNRHLRLQDRNTLERAFIPTVDTVASTLGPEALRPARALNAAVLDGVLVGIAARLTRGQITDVEKLRAQHAALLHNEEFVATFTKATADEESVRKRLTLARAAYEFVP